MKGTLYKTEEGWFVGNAKHSELPLHPDNVKICNQYGDYSIDWDSKEVEFEIVQEQYGDAFDNFTSYAKLLHHSVESNEMIDHIGDANKMVEDDAAPIDWLINQLENHIVLSAHGKLGTNRTGDYRIGLRKAIDFCHQAKEMEAKETLYTEEQVREVVKMAQTRKYNSHFYNADEIIKSLKQPKQ